jgi:hypothetical protein
MAADDPQLEAERVTELFTQYGANTTWIPVTATSNNADDSAVVSLTIGQDGFFFASGTRSRVLTSLRRNGVDSQVLTAIRVKLRSGAMVAGNSAGMAVLVGTFFPIKSADFLCKSTESAGEICGNSDGRNVGCACRSIGRNGEHSRRIGPLRSSLHAGCAVFRSRPGGSHYSNASKLSRYANNRHN